MVYLELAGVVVVEIYQFFQRVKTHLAARRLKLIHDLPDRGKRGDLLLPHRLFQGGQRVALVNVGGQIYQVRVGDYVGLNYGKVTRITETEIALREIVQDAVGEWVERTSNLQLVERSQEKGR